jgi:phosphohistidine swiveling domain-containing protein
MVENERLWDATPGFDFIEEIDLKEMNSFFLDGGHSIPPWTPLFSWFWNRGCGHGNMVACQEMSIPTCKGLTERFYQGGSYVSWYVVRDPEEIAARQEGFNKAMQPWLEDFDGLWGGYKKELLAMYAKIKELDLDKATNKQLFHHAHDLFEMYMHMWEIHFLGQYASHNGWILLDAMLKERFGINDQSPEFQDMMRGFDNKIYQMDKRLWEFAKEALDMGLEPVFLNNHYQDVIPKLKELPAGQKWLAGLMNWLETDEIGGWRMNRMNDITDTYWLEDPSAPIWVMKNFITKGMEHNLEEIRRELEVKREKAIAAMLNRVDPSEREIFTGLIYLAGKCSMYSEEHDVYCELYAHALLRRGFLGIGRRLTEKGTIDKPEDVFFLNPEEIDRVIMVPEAHDLRWITNRRRKQWEEWCSKPNPMFFTNRASLEEAVGMDIIPTMDPIAVKVVVGEMPEIKPELGADIFGLCACPGEAEGIAKVVFMYEDLKNVETGDILVCPGTNPAWTPVFGRVKAVICDRGGVLSHAAIIGREYGVPTIVNTFVGTEKIMTGMRVRVDAAEGAIYLLDK